VRDAPAWDIARLRCLDMLTDEALCRYAKHCWLALSSKRNALNGD
jgi:hypothetical protein